MVSERVVDGFLFETKPRDTNNLPRFCMGDHHLPRDREKRRRKRRPRAARSFSNRARTPKRAENVSTATTFPRRDKETKRLMMMMMSHTKERRSPNSKSHKREKKTTLRTDKSTRSRDAYLELRFRPVRLGPVDPAEGVLFARGVRSQSRVVVFGCCHDDV